jgi:hypothetical protein
MRVVSLIKRTQGHVVELDDMVYSFRPPHYAAEVKDPRHLARFSQIPEGYLVLEVDKPAEEPDKPLVVAPRRRGRPPKRLEQHGNLAG